MVYVTMTDRFLSGWGKAADKISKVVLECDTYEEAEIVADNAHHRSDMKRIIICLNKPRYGRNHVVDWGDKTTHPRFYERGYFAARKED